MIIVICDMKVDPAKQDEFFEKVNASGVIAATGKEPGNISYELAASAGVKGNLYIVERWESQEALDQHMKGTNFAEFGKIGAAYGMTGTPRIYQAELLRDSL